MTVDRALLLRYLRQRRELGERELLLDELTAAEVLAWVWGGGGAGRGRGAGRVGAGADTGPAAGPAGSGAAIAPDAGRAADRASTGRSPERGAAVPSGSAPHSAIVAAAASPEGAPDPATVAAANPAAAEGLRILGQEAAGCTRCRLHEGRRNVVFGEGSPVADLVVVGEAPGGEEDRTGRPFVGPAGHLLDLLLLTIGLPRERVYICNVLKCRPPNNRDPMSDEVEACSSYLHRQLDLIAPRVLLAVGKFAAQTLAGSEESIGRLRGRVHEYRGTPVVATYHPAYLLRSPSRVRVVWEDLQLVLEILDK